MAAGGIKGITIEIGGDTTKLDKALSGVNKNSRDLQNELKQVDKLLKLDPKNTELLAQKQELLKKAVSETKDKLDILRDAEKQVQAQFERGEVSEKQYRELQREIIATEENLKNLEASAKESNLSLEKIADVTGKIGEKSEALGKKLLPVTGAIVGVGVASIAAFNEVDSGYDTIITKTGATGEALEGLQGSMDNVFSELPIDAEIAGVAIGEVNTRFGATGETLENLSKRFIEFSEINGVDLNNSIGQTDKIMEQFGVTSDKTANVLGLLTAKGQETGLGVDALLSSVQKNGAVFKEMGLNLEQSIVFLSEMEKNGVNADTAIAGLRKSVANYTKDGKSTEEALQITIDSIKNATTETEAMTLASEVFGNKGAAEMSRAIREGRLSIDDLSTSLEDYGTVVEDTFNATLDPPDQAKVALNNLKLAGADLGNSLMTALQPALTKIVESVKGFTQWFKNLSNSQKENIIKIGALVAAIAPALIIFGKVTKGISAAILVVGKIKTAIAAAKTAFAAFNVVLAANPIGLIVAGIVALIAVFVLAYNKCEWFRNMVNEAFAQIKAAIAKAVEQIKPIIQQIGEAFRKLMDSLKPIIKQIGESFKKLMDSLKPVIQFFMTYVLSIVQGIISALAPIVAAVKNAVDFITNIINAVIALFKGDFDGFGQYIMAALQNVIDFIMNIVQAVINYVVTFFAGFGVDIKQIFTDIWQSIVNIFTGVGQWFTDRFTEAYTGVTQVFSAIGQWFANIWQGIANIFTSVGQWFTDRFTEAYTGIVNIFSPIVAWFAPLFESIKELVSLVGQWIALKFQNAYTNVTNVFKAIGQWFAARWQDIQNALAPVANWFLTIFQSAYTNVTSVFKAIGQWFAARWQDIQNALSAVATWFLTMFQNAYTNVTNVFKAIGQWFAARWQDIQNALAPVANWFLTIFQSAYTNVTSVFKAIGQWFTDRYNDITNAFKEIPNFFKGIFDDAWENIKGAFSGVIDFFTGIRDTIMGFFDGIADAIRGEIEDATDATKRAGGSDRSRRSTPEFARGGILRNGRGIVAEAGPELIEMVNGAAIITPLSGSANNTAVRQASGAPEGFRQVNNFYSPKALDPYETARLARNATRGAVLKLQGV